MTALLEAPELVGYVTPRLFTQPLVVGPPGPCGCGCALTPTSSLGFQACEFAEHVIGMRLLPWQRFLLVHSLELRPDGTFRFKTVLTLVARQNGKTSILKILALYFMYMRDRITVLGAAQSLDTAREAWSGACELAEDVEDLAAEVAAIRKANGEQTLTLANGSRYKISAATRGAGRGLSVDLLILDEVREHRDWLAWGALSKTTTARPNALIMCISNAGDDQSVVLNSLRSAALAGNDETLAIFEWSAPDGCQVDDPQAWAQANPGLGHTVQASTIRSALATDPPEVFRTETLCMRVDALDAAVDLDSWKACTDTVGNLGAVRERVAACLDVAADGGHVTLAGAGVLDDGRVRVEVLGAWPTVDHARRELPSLLRRIRPAALAWFPSGPAAPLGADLRGARGLVAAMPGRDAPGVLELKGQEVIEVCQGLAEQVAARKVAHPGDPLLNAHVFGAAKLKAGDGWRFSRKGEGHVDAAYAAAGAVYVARTLPAPTKRVKAQVF